MKEKEKGNKIGIKTLLKKNISKGQLAGYFIANVVGLTIILSGILFFCDTRSSRNEKDSYFSDDYIVISKKVKGLNLEPVVFSSEETEELAQQPWVRKIGNFTASDFSVNASIEMGGKGMSTYMFFESVPDDFFDTKPRDWEFREGNKFIPIVLNKDYLALYNFGFAIPQGLPQLSEEIIGSVPLRIKITGNGLSEYFDASVVGFSSRLNTIAVPQEFMDWANARFSDDAPQEASRLILKIDRLQASSMENFMKEKGFEIAGDKEGSSKVSDFMGVVAGVVAANGLVISLLALFILLLSIFLILQKSRGMLRDLLLLGYSPQQVGKYYERMVTLTNSLIIILSVGLTFIFRIFWIEPLHKLDLGYGSVLPMLIAAAIYLIIVTLINIGVIRRHLIQIWHNR